MRNGMRRSVLGNENVHAKCDESADGGREMIFAHGSHESHEFQDLFGLFSQFCLEVSGEKGNFAIGF